MAILRRKGRESSSVLEARCLGSPPVALESWTIPGKLLESLYSNLEEAQFNTVHSLQDG